MRQAWSGEPFEWRGRTIVVTPTPISAPEQLMWLGGSVRRSAERAARLGLPFFTMSTDPELGDVYRDACADVGYTSGFFAAPRGPLFTHVAEDPERAWRDLAPYAVYDVVSYNAWQTGDHDNVAASTATTADELVASGLWQVVTPDQCIELARRYGSVVLHPLMGGMPPELGWQSLRLFVDEVLPAL
jgi:alkanesulfonate monooxygenase SsuD/methylene tetrahydromethanopterin reductase-like flavin-dependent oxidoreductase (luciferase family)